MQDSKTLDLAKQLISIASLTPNDAGCQTIISDYLQKLDFKIEKLKFGDVDNIWARRGNAEPLFVFIGHTDVVPPGPLEKWTSPPFQPEVRQGMLYGRGAADMKGSIAAMLVAAENFVKQHPDHAGSIAFLITSDEEGIARDGTVKVVEHLQQRKEKINYCLVGEASCVDHLGDTLKIGRRGSLNAELKIHGKQGHIAYPKIAENPIHKATAAITELCSTHWDHGNEQFQPTSMQISNINAGTGADNVIPGQLQIIFNFRYSPEVTAEQLQQKVEAILKSHQLNYTLNWRLSGKPFLTATGKLLAATQQAARELTHIEPKLSTGGGTSDGRFIAATGSEVIELGPCNGSIHQIDEHVSVNDLEKLSGIYQRILELLLVD
jgi:succinyl-diaminopimelate desuccinylase